MADTKLIKDFAEILSEKGFEIANRDTVSQVPPSEYKYAKQMFALTTPPPNHLTTIPPNHLTTTPTYALR